MFLSFLTDYYIIMYYVLIQNLFEIVIVPTNLKSNQYE